MSMPTIYKRLWQLMWGIVFVFFLIYGQAMMTSADLDKLKDKISTLEQKTVDIETLNAALLKDNKALFQKVNEINEKPIISYNIMPSCLIKEPQWTRNKRTSH